MSDETFDAAIATAKPEAIADARELATKAWDLAKQMLTPGATRVALSSIDDALAAAKELDEKLAGRVAEAKAAHDLAMQALQKAGAIALRIALAGLA